MQGWFIQRFQLKERQAQRCVEGLVPNFDASRSGVAMGVANRPLSGQFFSKREKVELFEQLQLALQNLGVAGGGGVMVARCTQVGDDCEAVAE